MKLFLVLVFAITSLLSSGAHALDLAAVLKAGKLRVAVDTTYPPMEFEDAAGKVTGLDVDLAREIAKVLKVEAEFIVMPWDGILAGLQSNRYDIIMSSMNVTSERAAQVNFVPYITMGQVFVVKKMAKPVILEKDLAGRTVAVQVDTTSFNAVEAILKSGVKISAIKTCCEIKSGFCANSIRLKRARSCNCVCAKRIPRANSALSSKSEFAQAGPCPFAFFV